MFPASGIQEKRNQSEGDPIRLLNTGRPGKVSNTGKDVEGERRKEERRLGKLV